MFNVCLTTCFTSAQTFTVGTATAAPGEKALGAIEVPAGRDAAASIPVAVFRGAKPGPVLALVSGSHGTGYGSVIALEKLIQSLDPAQISGTVVILPLVNIPSFEQKVPHLNPVDGKSMNRFYPGNPAGSQTERVSWQITKQVVERCDYKTDYHGGDLDESLRPYAYWPKSGNAKHDATTRDMVLAFGLDHIIVWSDRPQDPNASRYLDNTHHAQRAVDEQLNIFRPDCSFGRIVYEATAPAAGVVLYICGVPSMRKGDTVVNIGEITTNP